MGRAKRPPGNQRFPQRKRPGDRMDLGRLERFVETHLGQDGGEPAREHRLPGSRRTHHQNVVAARRRHLERAFRVRLSLYFGEIDIVARALCEQPRYIHGGSGELGLTIQKVGDFRKTCSAQNLQTLHDAGFRQILFGKDEGFDARHAGRERDGQRATNRSDRALEPELAEHGNFRQAIGRDLLGRRENAQRDREIKCRAFLADVRGREINGDALERKGETGVGEGRRDPIPSFLHRPLRQADRYKGRQPAGNVGLDIHEIRIDPEDGGGADAGEHGRGYIFPRPGG